MIIIRLLVVIVVLIVVLSAGAYLYTRDRRYLRFAWQAFRLSIYAMLVFALLFVLERYILVAWRVLL
ncbi:MAG: hypothetical protein WA632_02955 [Gallionella sp.]